MAIDDHLTNQEQESRFIVQKGEISFLTPEEVEKRLITRYVFEEKTDDLLKLDRYPKAEKD